MILLIKKARSRCLCVIEAETNYDLRRSTKKTKVTDIIFSSTYHITEVAIQAGHKAHNPDVWGPIRLFQEAMSICGRPSADTTTTIRRHVQYLLSVRRRFTDDLPFLHIILPRGARPSSDELEVIGKTSAKGLGITFEYKLNVPAQMFIGNSMIRYAVCRMSIEA